VSPGVDISIYRIVQEGLTNTLKHAEAQHATVRVAFDGDHVEIEILDDGRHSAPQGNASGHGLSGMRERVALYGGTLDAGPRPQGGWALRVSLPREPAP
jgi:signal transduction histidine kinase